jgi:hypothetical protein
MHASLQSEYLAGLWHSGLPHQLLWYVPEGERVTRSSTYQAPSWSWASLDGKVVFFDMERRLPPFVSVLSHDVTLKDNQPFGQFTGGFLRLRGHLCRASFLKSGPLSWSEPPVLRNVVFTLKSPAEKLVVCCRFHMDSYPPSKYRKLSAQEAIGFRTFYLLPIVRDQPHFSHGGVNGLVLQHTGVTGQYRRLGLFYSSDNTVEHWDSLIERKGGGLGNEEFVEFHGEDGGCTVDIV